MSLGLPPEWVESGRVPVIVECADCDAVEGLVEVTKGLRLCRQHGRLRYGPLGAILIGIPPNPEEALALNDAGIWSGYDSEGDYYSGTGE